MTERTAIYAKPDPANLGQALVEEVAAGDTLRGTIPSSAVAAHAVVGGDSSGAPVGIPINPLSILGRLATGALTSIDLTGLMTILNAAMASAGAADVGRLLKLNAAGKLDVSFLEQTVLDPEVNQGASLGFTIPIPGDHGHVYKDKVGEVLQFRGIMTETPDTVLIHERATDIAVSVVIKDGETGATKLWSSSKIAAEIALLVAAIAAAAAQSEVSGDTTPELGGPLDLAGFSIMHDIGGVDETELMSVDMSTGSPQLKLMGLVAVLAILTNAQDGETLAYDAAQKVFVNVPPAQGGGAAPTVDLFETIATSNKAFVQSTASPLKLASVQPQTPSANWQQSGVSGGTYTSNKYVGVSAQRYRIRFGVTVIQSVSNEEAVMKYVIRKSSDGVSYSDVAGSIRHDQVSYKGSTTVEATALFQPGDYVELSVLHENGGAASVQSVAFACSVQLESINVTEAV